MQSKYDILVNENNKIMTDEIVIKDNKIINNGYKVFNKVNKLDKY